MRFLIFFLFWFSLLGFAYWYVGRRIIRTSFGERSLHRRAWVVVGLLFILPQIPFLLLVMGVESAANDFLSWAGYICLGFFSLVFTGLILRDLVLLIEKLVTLITRWVRKHRVAGGTPYNPERRALLLYGSNLGIIGIAAGLSGYGVHECRRRAIVEEVAVPIARLPEAFDGFRIVQFTDIHVGPTIKRPFVEGIVEQIITLQGDMIVFTGDLVDGSVGWLRDEVAPIQQLAAPNGVYFVTGNHEYYSGAVPWVKEAGRLGFDVLLNEHRVITRGSERILLAGITDFSAGDFVKEHRSDPIAALGNSGDAEVRILLAHQPRSIHDTTEVPFDLQLSGHTHGGQFFPWNYLATLNQPYIKGLHKHNGRWIYVNRGTGYWGPPLRLGIPPEITVITLRKG